MGQILTTLRALFYEIVASKKGVRPSFEPAHAVKLLLILYEREPIGRNTLSKMLSLSITSVRTLIRRMKEWELISVDTVGGCYLTNKGREVVSKILSIVPRICDISRIIGEDLRLAKYAWASVIKQGVALIEKIGIVNVRDSVVAHGSKASLIIFASNEHTYIPPDYSFNETKYSSLRRLKELLAPGNGDAIIVSFSEDPIRAEKALLNTIIDLFLDFK